MVYGSSLLSVLLALLDLLAGLVAAAAGEPPAGMVMEVAGVTIPALVPRSEIAAFAPIQVPPGSQLVFLHYRACVLVTVTGGTITLTPSGIDEGAATIGRVRNAPCPSVHRISASDGPPVASGVPMRGLPVPLRLPAQLDLIVTGAGARDIGSVAIREAGDKIVARSDAAALKTQLRPNETYRLSITFNGRSRPLDVPFTAAVDTQDVLSILAID
jgi:hypothetical protein